MGHSDELGFFILVDAGGNDVHEIRKDLISIDQVRVVHCLIGPTDLICYGKVDSLAELSTLLTERVTPLIDARFNPIKHTQTLVSVGFVGTELTAPQHGCPDKVAAWVFADVSLGLMDIPLRLLENFPEIVSVHNVLGDHDTLFYVEAESLQRLQTVIDEGVRVLRGIGRQGQHRKALSRTDTRLVLM